MSGQRLIGSAHAIVTAAGCICPAFFPAALVTGPLPPVFAPPSLPPGLTVRVIDTSTTIPNLTAPSELRQSNGICQALNFIPAGPQDGHSLRLPTTLPFVPPFTLAVE